MDNKTIIVLCGPPGSGKSTLAKDLEAKGFVRISQDEQGKEHLNLFHQTVSENKNIVIDRMSFNSEQRQRYLVPAKSAGYTSKIIVLHESRDTCFDRMSKRIDHPTIKNEINAKKALDLFFSKYERVTNDEADFVIRRWPSSAKRNAIIVDIDGTIADVEHRRDLLGTGKRKNWAAFFNAMDKDTLNLPIAEIVLKMEPHYDIVYCSGRPENYRKVTQEWLEKYNLPKGPLLMRHRQDSRQDNIIKEIILDFELLTKYEIFFCLDDRDNVIKMWRSRGITALQVAEGNF